MTVNLPSTISVGSNFGDPSTRGTFFGFAMPKLPRLMVWGSFDLDDHRN